MLTQTFLSIAFASLTLVQATSSSFQLRDLQSAGKCVNDCLLGIKTVSDCAKSGDASCACSFDASTITKILKCSFDCVTLDDLKEAQSLPSSPVSGGQCGSTTPPPKGTLASNFSLPACASQCLTQTSFTGCTGSSDVACVCGILESNSTSGDAITSSYNYEKCMLDKCSDRDAARATIQLGADCGQFSASTPSSQFPYPNNKLKEVYDSPNSSAGLRGPAGAVIGLIGVALGLMVL